MLLTSTIIARKNNAPALLLIHGMGSASTAWKTILGHLQEHFTIVMIDLPGHGKTPMDSSQLMDPQSLARAVIETMHSHDIDHFHVVGNSLGGWIALEMGAMKPEAIASITGLAPAGLWLAPYNARYPGTAVARILAISVGAIAPFALRFRWARKLGFKDVSPRWDCFSYETCLDAVRAIAKSAGYYPAWDAMLKKRFNGIIPPSVPVTVIFGDSDKTLPAPRSQERSLVPEHTRWIVFRECGHAPMWDFPEKVVEEILRTARQN